LVTGVKRRAWDGWIYKEEESPCVYFFGEVTLNLETTVLLWIQSDPSSVENISS
jgi:hypothetical protein